MADPRPLMIPTPTVNASASILPYTQHTYDFTAKNAQYHTLAINSEGLAGNFTLRHKGITTTWSNLKLKNADGTNIPFVQVFLMIIDPDDQTFQFGFNGGKQGAMCQWNPGWTDPTVLYGFLGLMEILKNTKEAHDITFMGTGHSLHSQEIIFPF
jgi:hypothetical protein